MSGECRTGEHLLRRRVKKHVVLLGFIGLFVKKGYMGMGQKFEDLWVWQEARKLVQKIYQDFGKESPAKHDYEFKNQIFSAGYSIMNNISEGYERESNAETANFLNIAKGSCGEVRNMYYIAEDQQYVTAETAKNRRTHAAKISIGLQKFKKFLYASDPKRANRLLKDINQLNTYISKEAE